VILRLSASVKDDVERIAEGVLEMRAFGLPFMPRQEYAEICLISATASRTSASRRAAPQWRANDRARTPSGTPASPPGSPQPA
jgi:hypothetical protein